MKVAIWIFAGLSWVVMVVFVGAITMVASLPCVLLSIALMDYVPFLYTYIPMYIALATYIWIKHANDKK